MNFFKIFSKSSSNQNVGNLDEIDCIPDEPNEQLLYFAEKGNLPEIKKLFEKNDDNAHFNVNHKDSQVDLIMR